jgi:hypothetical protein
MNAVTQVVEQMPSGHVVTTDAAAILAVISRAASDPNVDTNKLQTLLGMYERITASRAKSEFDSAFAQMQPELPVVGKNGKITIKEKGTEKVIQSTPYALFEDINIAATPVLSKYGFAISFRTSAEAKVKVTAILSHKGGHREETSLDLMHDSTGSKNSVQAIGSSVSYGKRYTMCAILNITTGGEDDDGAAAGGITEEQCKELSALIAETKTDLNKFLAHMKVEALFQIPEAQFAKAKHALETKRAKK